MQIQEGTPVKTITVQGVKVDVPQPFAEGHVLTEPEAAALNQVLAENLRNNQASKMKKAQAEVEKKGEAYRPAQADIQAEMNAYIEEYEFGQRRTGGTSTAHLDPVEKEMQNMAKTAIKTAIQSKGYKLKDVPRETMDKLVDEYLANNEDSLRTNAEQVVKARESVGNVELDLGGI